MNLKTSQDFSVKSLGVQELDVYDIEVDDNHNFFGNGILVHNSNYIQLEEVIEKLGLDFKTDDEFRLWSYDFIDDVLQPLIDSKLQEYADEFGIEQKINFKREKIISDMFITGKKHYITRVLDSEGKVYDTPDYSNTGLESKKSDTPDFIKDVLSTVLNMILENEEKTSITDYVKQKRSEYETLPLYEIGVPGKIGDYSKYAETTEYYIQNGLGNYKSHTPRRTKAAIHHNYVIKQLGMTSRLEIESNIQLRYVELMPNNKFRIDVIGFSGEYPTEFESVFNIDYTKMWDSTCMKLLTNWYGVLQWGKPSLISNSLMDFFK